ncbi:hypothetical protein CPAR01_13782 [Colletotrichum paranaense]|uniref:Uncharacterized protein n=1 Tax=Colletotrichum paranaense TaxID=1914294 RepID=A0ABQ9S5M1_9PEZI|nr:uncharacterized protein CPAR01_13782 [Colletotrichum paranaense]KAK1524834.1 hypothetical protein CPAR01_13782 [Colletotrichum paranaense]
MDVDVVSIPSTDNEAPEENRRESAGGRDVVAAVLPSMHVDGAAQSGEDAQHPGAEPLAPIQHPARVSHDEGMVTGPDENRRESPGERDAVDGGFNQQSGPHDFLGAPRALLLDVLVLSCQPSRLKRSMKTISTAPRVPLVPPIGPDLTEDPNEGHFELLVDVSEEIDRNVPTGMAVSHAKELRNTQVRIIYNRRKTVVSLASPAPAHTGVPTEDDFDLPVAVSQEVDREALTSIAVSLAKTLRGINIRVISNRKEIVYLLRTLNSDRESALKANLLKEFKILNGRPRRHGQKNETVTLKVLKKHLAISSNDVRRIIKATKLPWILALVWGRGSVMSPPPEQERIIDFPVEAFTDDTINLTKPLPFVLTIGHTRGPRRQSATSSSIAVTHLSAPQTSEAPTAVVASQQYCPGPDSSCETHERAGRLLRVCTFFPRFEGAKTVFRVT